MEIKYSTYYSEKSLWEKLKRFAKKAGEKATYAVLLLFYLLKDKKISIKSRIAVAAALGYFILPADVIFDLTPLIGFSDDLTILIATLYKVSKNVTPEIQIKARKKLFEWYNKTDEKALFEIDSQIEKNQSDKI